MVNFLDQTHQWKLYLASIWVNVQISQEYRIQKYFTSDWLKFLGLCSATRVPSSVIASIWLVSLSVSPSDQSESELESSSESDGSKSIVGYSSIPLSTEQKSMSSSVKHFNTRDLSKIEGHHWIFENKSIKQLTSWCWIIKIELVMNRFFIFNFFISWREGTLENRTAQENNHNCCWCLSSSWFRILALESRSNNCLKFSELQ